MRLLPVLCLLPLSAFAGDDDEPDLRVPTSYEFNPSPSVAPARMRAPEMSATIGGAQDASFYRAQASLGRMPRAQELPLEGLLSEYDLPLSDPAPCRRLFCVEGDAFAADVLVEPDVQWIAQLGFTSRLTSDFQRSPLNLVVVVDRSGSMAGQPLALVQETLKHVLQESLGPKDQVSVVVFSDTATEVVRAAAPSSRAAHDAVDALVISGGTNLDAGIAMGIDVARQTRERFQGETRLLVLTDERPNVGRTDAASFMGQLRDAAHSGIGVTTVGVSTEFAAVLAGQVASVRGASLVYFRDATEMRDRLIADFDALMTPLAYDLVVDVTPADGVALQSVYGVPAGSWSRTESGGMRIEAETLFASNRAGAIFLGFAPDGRFDGSGPLATAQMAYDPVDGRPQRDEATFAVRSGAGVGEGLVRGARVVDIGTGLRAASTAFHAGDLAESSRILSALERRLTEVTDPALAEDIATVRSLATAARAASPITSATYPPRGTSGP